MENIHVIPFWFFNDFGSGLFVQLHLLVLDSKIKLGFIFLSVQIPCLLENYMELFSFYNYSKQRGDSDKNEQTEIVSNVMFQKKKKKKRSIRTNKCSCKQIKK
jgi:hypothetical protein